MKSRWRPSNNQKKAMKKEINVQVIEANKQYTNDIDAAILYTLHMSLGYGPKRLRKFYDDFKNTMLDLENYYNMPTESGWLCRQKLKDIGVDVEEWNRETET